MRDMANPTTKAEYLKHRTSRLSPDKLTKGMKVLVIVCYKSKHDTEKVHYFYSKHCTVSTLKTRKSGHTEVWLTDDDEKEWRRISSIILDKQDFYRTYGSGTSGTSFLVMDNTPVIQEAI